MAETSAGLARLMLDVVMPRGCAGCGIADEVLCDRCLAWFSAVDRPVSSVVSASGAVWCAGWYRGPVRRAVLAWKDHRDEEVGRDLGALIGALASRAAPGMPPQVLVVPLPSSRPSLMRRGRWQTLELAWAVTDGLRAAGTDADVAPMLRMGRARKSVGAGHARDRAARLEGRLRVVGQHGGGRHGRQRGRVVLVDDIVTTGATMSRCSSILAKHGYEVVGAFALACAPEAGQMIRDDGAVSASMPMPAGSGSASS